PGQVTGQPPPGPPRRLVVLQRVTQAADRYDAIAMLARTPAPLRPSWLSRSVRRLPPVELCSITYRAKAEVYFMILNVDLTSEVPIYQQLRDRIVEAIADGVLTEGSSLPATRALAADFGINFHTVNKAYDLLRQQGLIRLNRK